MAATHQTITVKDAILNGVPLNLVQVVSLTPLDASSKVGGSIEHLSELKKIEQLLLKKNYVTQLFDKESKGDKRGMDVEQLGIY